jgi:mono/diheme cytochrome c family protein
MPGVFPPLAGSEITAGAPEIPIRIVLHGVQGPLTVKGQRFNGTMPPWGQFSDADIAATLTYVRSQWGNAAAAVTAAQVTAVRQATAGRNRAWTGAEIEALLRGQ